MADAAKHPVKSLYTTEAVLEGLADLDGATVTDLAEHLNRPRSVVHNHLSTLRELEYVVQSGDEYRLGLRFLQRGELVRARTPPYAEAKREMRTLAERTGELITLIVEEHGLGVYLAVAQESFDVEYPAVAGTRTRLHTTSAGKTILAHLPAERVEAIVDRHGLEARTSETITDRAALSEELEAIRDRGYAYDRGEFREGMRAVAAPILATDGSPVGGLSVAGPARRLTGERLESELPETLLQSVNVIELNYNDPTAE